MTPTSLDLAELARYQTAPEDTAPTGECPDCGVALWQGEQRCSECDNRRDLRISRGKRP